MSVEQYDTPAYRRHCREIIAPVIDTLVALADDGCVIRNVLGVDGSPSCGVAETCSGYCGGELEQILRASDSAPRAVRRPGRGILMQELGRALREAGIEDVPLIGFNEVC
jgi:predicted secreted protein